MPFVRLHGTTGYMCSTFIGRTYCNYGGYVTFRYTCTDDIVPSSYSTLKNTGKHRLSGPMVRLIRFIGAAMSLFLLPFWYLLATKPKYLPDILSYIGPNEIGEVPLFVQLLTADVGIEVLRMAAIHTPTPMSTAMGLVAAIVIGQVAIDVGLFTPEVVLYVAVSAVFTFAIPSYELGITTKVFRIGILTGDSTFRSSWIFRCQSQCCSIICAP